MPEYLALDVGGTSIKHAVIDDSYRLFDKGVLPHEFTSNDEFIDAIGRLYDPVADRVSGIAMSCCGELNPTTGVMLSGGRCRSTRAPT